LNRLPLHRRFGARTEKEQIPPTQFFLHTKVRRNGKSVWFLAKENPRNPLDKRPQQQEQGKCTGAGRRTVAKKLTAAWCGKRFPRELAAAFAGCTSMSRRGVRSEGGGGGR
jgi:hypothetical protein